MGSFGLSDYLNKRGITTKIFNASLYDAGTYLDRLYQTIDTFKPDLIGLVMHWQELLLNTVLLSCRIKEAKDIPIVAGGFTAGFFAEELLKRVKDIDFIIKGDPEKPIELLIQGEDYRMIPNLLFRDNGSVEVSKKRYLIDSKTLSRISFSEVRYLIDFEKYIKKARARMGFPVFIGRGCKYNCLYCGGSKLAFLKHSNRERPVCRTTASIIKDLKSIAAHTDTLFICYEVDAGRICDLFEAMLAEKNLAGRFRINYCTFSLMKPRMVDLYAKVCKFDGKPKPVIAISPEVTLDGDRNIVRDRAVHFSNKELIHSIKMINKKLKDSVKVEVCYSRYHIIEKKYSQLTQELGRIYRLWEYLCKKLKYSNVSFSYMQLSTEPGSAYWRFLERTTKKTITLPWILDYASKHRKDPMFPTDHFCLLPPRNLNNETVERYERLVEATFKMHENNKMFFPDANEITKIDSLVKVSEKRDKGDVGAGGVSFFKGIKDVNS